MSATHDSPDVSESDPEATVLRMEERLRQDEHPEVQELLRLYSALSQRFAADLSPSRREIAIARSAALMLIQARRAAA
jgi:hypothetical protein